MVAQKSQKEIYEVSSETIKETECACSSLIRHASRARLDLKQGFETIDEIQDPDPNNFSELEIPKSLIGRL